MTPMKAESTSTVKSKAITAISTAEATIITTTKKKENKNDGNVRNTNTSNYCRVGVTPLTGNLEQGKRRKSIKYFSLPPKTNCKRARYR